MNETMITGANHYTLVVADLEYSFKFYREILGLKPLCKWGGLLAAKFYLQKILFFVKL